MGTYASEIAVPLGHRLIQKERLDWEDLAGETLMLLEEGASPIIDQMRQELLERSPGIIIRDLPPFYTLAEFNACASQGCLMEVISAWDGVHPLLKTLPMNWNYEIPYGLVCPRSPDAGQRLFIEATQKLCQGNPK